MKNVLFMLLAGLFLSGCAHRYDITLVNGVVITHVSKPIFDQQTGVFTYTDIKGEKRYINAGRVVEIAPHRERKVAAPPSSSPVTAPSPGVPPVNVPPH